MMKLKFTCIIIILLCLPMAWLQAQTVSGVVTDAETSEPLIGANVAVKGGAAGAVTDINGNYTINIDGGEVLVFTYVGYRELEISIDGRSTIDVQMKAGSDLDEVIVVGYQEKKKSDLTGSVAVVDMDAVGKMPYANVLQSLQGRVAGVNITQDGQPGEGRTQIRVRGITTLNNNSPLFVVDGIPTTESLANLNPNDIESIQVLKDAAAASIYGSRSAGGVVVITTKKGRAGKVSIDAGILNGVQTLGNKIDLLNATEWGESYWAAFRNSFPNATPQHPLYGTGETPVISNIPLLTPSNRQIYIFTPEGTDWYDAVYQNAFQQQYYFNVSSGNEKSSVLFGASYYDQEGLIKNTYFDRLTARLNSDYKFTDWLKIGENMSVSFSDQVQIGSQQGQDGIPLDVIRQHPLLPVYAFDSTYAGKIGGLPDVRNMVSVLDKNQDNTTDSWRVFGNVYAQADVFKAIPAIPTEHSLTLKTTLGIDYSNFYNRQFNAAFQEGDFDVQDNSLTNTFGKGLTRTWINTLEYKFSQGNHAITFLGGMESVDYDYTFLTATRNSFEVESPSFTYLSAGAGSQTNGGGGTEWGLLSYFGRADYTLMDKYLFSATLRYDQTSRLNTDGIFPAASFGWRISEEPFMNSLKEGKILDNAKVRLSYGQQGNQSVGDFATLSIFGADVNHADYDILGSNSGVLQGYRVISTGNPNLRWETTEQYNAGIDLNLFDYRVNFSLDYYLKNTYDILLRAPQIAALGEGDFPFVNAAEVRNTGLDLQLGYTRYQPNSDWGFSTQFQLNTFSNKVISLGEGIANIGNEGEEYINGGDGPTRIVVGRPIGSFYGYQVQGIFQTVEEAQSAPDQGGNDVGRLQYADINGDTLLNDLDRTYIGAPYPDFSMGLNLEASYKNFSLSAFLYSAIGQDVYNEMKWYMDFAQNGNFNRSTRILDAWSPTNTSSTIPAPTLTNANVEDRPSDYFVEKASYLRLRSLRLGYEVPKQFTKGYNVNVYTEVQNVFTVSGYSGVDPEVPHAGNNNFPGIDRGVYPLPRTFMIGINVKN